MNKTRVSGKSVASAKGARLVHTSHDPRKKGAIVDFTKGLTTVKDGHFETCNQELGFAKYVSKFSGIPVVSPPKTERDKDPIVQSHLDFHTALRRIKQSPAGSGLTTIGVRPSRDEILQRRNMGDFHDLKRPQPKEWRPCMKLVDEYTSKKRLDDADLKRGLRHIPDQHQLRNPIVDGDLKPPKEIKIRHVGLCPN